MSYGSYSVKMQNTKSKEPRYTPEDKRRNKPKPDYSNQRKAKRGEE